MIPIEKMAQAAWDVRKRARVLGATKVGCAVADEVFRLSSGCNIEHQFRSHDIHAEIAAISSLVAGGGTAVVAMFIAAERTLFTPCGACLDWIFELGGPDCDIFIQSSPKSEIHRYIASDLMPYYPQ